MSVGEVSMERPGLLRIFCIFLRLGLTAFGGPAMIPYIRAQAVDRQGWLSDESFGFGMSVTQMIPGATAMQMAAYSGLRARGAWGAVAAYLGFSLPAFVLMLGLSALYFSARDMAWVQHLFQGLQAAVIALMANAALNFARRYLGSVASVLLALLAGVWFGLKGNPILALMVVCLLAVFVFRREQAPAGAGRTALHCDHRRAALGMVLFMLGSAAVLYFINTGLLDLAVLMAKIDCFAFGGGYVSVPLMLHEVVEVRGWLTEAQFMDGIALGQVTPGPIVMTATFVGYAVKGVPGAVIATVAVFSPSLLILLATTPFYERIAASSIARRVLKGSLVSLVGLMAAVAVRFALTAAWTWPMGLVCLGAFAALRLRGDILWVVLAAGGASVLLGV